MALRASYSFEPSRQVGLWGWGAALLVAVLIGYMSVTMPEETRGITAGILLTTIVVWALRRTVRQHPDCDSIWPVVRLGIAQRLIFVFVHLAVGLWFYGGQIDFQTYLNNVQRLFSYLAEGRLNLFNRSDFTSFSEFITTLLIALVAVAPGGVLIGLFLVFGAVGAVGAYLFFRAFETVYPENRGRRFLAATLFLWPSIGFWSIFFGKDVWTFLFLGWATYSFAKTLKRSDPRAVVGLGISLALLFATRSHVGTTVTMGIMAAWLFRPLRWSETVALLQPVYRTVMLVFLAFVFLTVGYQVIIHYGVEALRAEMIAERLFRIHEGFATTPGGAALPQVISEGTPGAVLSSLPLGMVTFLFRPFLWEAHNILAMATALDSLFLLLLVVWRVRHLAAAVRSAFSEAFMLYVVIAFLGTTAILSFEWNLGTMARHRTMVLPYLMMLLAFVPDRKPEPDR
jgi:hypothetical protein